MEAEMKEVEMEAEMKEVEMEAEMEVEMEWIYDAIDSIKEIATIDTDYQQDVIKK